MPRKTNTAGTIFIASIAGGTVEVGWVALFCLFTPLHSSLVAEEVAQSFMPHITGMSAFAAGLIIHYVLAVLVAGIVAIILLRLLRHRSDMRSVIVVSMTALAAIWAINFFVILPLVNADFVMLMPYAVTLASKLGFGAATGCVFGVRATASTEHALNQRFALR